MKPPLCKSILLLARQNCTVYILICSFPASKGSKAFLPSHVCRKGTFSLTFQVSMLQYDDYDYGHTGDPLRDLEYERQMSAGETTTLGLLPHTLPQVTDLTPK